MVWLRRNCRCAANFLTVRSIWKNTRPHEISTLQPNDAGFTAMFPGRFLGGSTPGSTSNLQPLVSYGVVNVDLKDAQGNKLKLAPDARATLSFPIPSNDPGSSSIPLWSLDTDSGVWVQEGAATRSGASYVASVTHFSPWNCDIPLASSTITETSAPIGQRKVNFIDLIEPQS